MGVRPLPSSLQCHCPSGPETARIGSKSAGVVRRRSPPGHSTTASGADGSTKPGQLVDARLGVGAERERERGGGALARRAERSAGGAGVGAHLLRGRGDEREQPESGYEKGAGHGG